MGFLGTKLLFLKCQTLPFSFQISICMLNIEADCVVPVSASYLLRKQRALWLGTKKFWGNQLFIWATAKLPTKFSWTSREGVSLWDTASFNGEMTHSSCHIKLSHSSLRNCSWLWKRRFWNLFNMLLHFCLLHWKNLIALKIRYENVIVLKTVKLT